MGRGIQHGMVDARQHGVEKRQVQPWPHHGRGRIMPPRLEGDPPRYTRSTAGRRGDDGHTGRSPHGLQGMDATWTAHHGHGMTIYGMEGWTRHGRRETARVSVRKWPCAVALGAQGRTTEEHLARAVASRLDHLARDGEGGWGGRRRARVMMEGTAWGGS